MEIAYTTQQKFIEHLYSKFYKYSDWIFKHNSNFKNSGLYLPSCVLKKMAHNAGSIDDTGSVS